MKLIAYPSKNRPSYATLGMRPHITPTTSTIDAMVMPSSLSLKLKSVVTIQLTRKTENTSSVNTSATLTIDANGYGVIGWGELVK